MKLISGLSVRIVPHVFNMRYRLARWTRKSRFFGSIVRKTMFDGDEMVVLPKDEAVTTRDLELNIEVDQPGERTVLPSDVVKEMIMRADDIFIMDFCLCRKSNGCKDYPKERGCIFLGKGTRKISEKHGHLATKEEAVAYIDECSELGLVHIIGRNKLDSLWLGTGRKKDLMTICNCCPCCCLWNMVRDISKDISDCYRRMDGVTITTDSERCAGCGSCAEICFTRAITIRDGKASVDDTRCRCCGRCVERCSFDAIRIDYDPAKVGTEIERISELVNLTSE